MAKRTTYIIREVSPYLQAFLVSLLKDAYTARSNGDIFRYMDALSVLYHSMPQVVRDDIAEELRAAAVAMGLDVEFGLPEEVFDHVKRFCTDVMQQYSPPYSRERRRQECVRRGKEVLDLVYSVMMKALHKHNIFIVHREVVGTVYRPPGAGGGG